MEFAAILEWIIALAGGILLARWIMKVVAVVEEVREFYKKEKPESFEGTL